MNRTPEGSTCASFADDLGALAVGALTGRERADVLSHVERCASCAAELESLSTSADALLSLYPELEPGEGFAERVTARIEGDSPSRRRRPTRSLLVVAAAVMVLALAGGLTAVLAGRNPGNQGTAATATLQSPTGPAGKVVLTSGHGNWLVMMLEENHATGTVTCRVTLTDGSTRTVGRFALHGGYRPWTVRLPVPPSDIVAVTVTGQDGNVLASAAV